MTKTHTPGNGKRNASSKRSKSKVTMIDVAVSAGVSKSTVSLVLSGSMSVSDEKKASVNKAIKELGYVYNRGAAGLRGGPSNMVAILSNNLTSPYFAQVLMGLEPYLEQMGMMPIIMDLNESLERQSRFVASLREYNIAAIIITPAPGTTKEWIDNIHISGLPIVSIMREVENAVSPVVKADNRLGTFLSTQSLIQLGHRNIVFIGGQETFSDFVERKLGYLDAMREAELDVSAHFIQPGPSSRIYSSELAKEVLFKHPEITAFSCFSDEVPTAYTTA
ncbi:LacI family DNA-binding transcriptional regulator [Veronia nyctiphanis]|uniref:LacI family DNA-binding transcriptional regulator n=1 Tax=Veronia nyctiphanis TaxID=1278244 RepID=UPI001F3FA2E2|nr:LacI family DNA-binding transcriptional regulator [Veronia nyctiphanis]